jgi:hypothetical protein
LTPLILLAVAAMICRLVRFFIACTSYAACSTQP